MAVVSVFQSIKDLLPTLSESQARIAKVVIEDPGRVLQMNIVEFARLSNTSPSTIVELCKKLGFSGFKTFKISIAQEINLLQTMRPDPSRIGRITKDYFGFVFSELKESIQLINEEQIKDAAEEILKSKVVEILAYGFDGVAGKDLFLKLKELGFQVNFFDNPFLQSISASHLGVDGCAVAISSSHSSTDLLDSINYSKKSGARVLAIASPASKIAQACDILLPTYVKTEVLSEGGFLTRYLQLFVVDLLILKMLELDKERLTQRYRDFEQILAYKRRGDKGVF
ncbi:MAG: MurR/RpiR family transcriptional regulator [Pseudothermotoga sp.]